MGPSGATGATGATGAAGAAGSSGTNGANGRDSVVYSQWITLTTNVYRFTNNGKPDSVFVDTLSAPAISQAILDSGAVEAYVQNIFNQNGQLVVGQDSTVLNVLAYPGYLEVSYGLSKIVIAAQSDITGAQFRYVAIPSPILTQSSTFGKYTKSQIGEMSFNMVSNLVDVATRKTAP